MRTNRYIIGRIVGAHGIRGELKIKTLTDNPSRFDEMRSLRLYRGEDHLSDLSLRSVRHVPGKAIILALTEEIQDRDEAAALTGATVEVFAEERYPLGEEEWWVDDLIGLKAIDHDTDEELGVVADVIPAGPNDLYVIKDSSGADHYIPAVEEFIASVDLDAGQMRISLIDGLWEP